MSAFHKEVAKYFARYAAKTSPAAVAGSSNNSLLCFTPATKPPSRLRSFLEDALAPIWCRFFRGPLDRWNQAAVGKYLREHGKHLHLQLPIHCNKRQYYMY